MDPPDLPRGPQPTSWTEQRSEIREVILRFSQPIASITANDLVLTNLGVHADVDPDLVIALQDQQLTLSPDGLQLTIRFSPGQLSDGVYQLEVLPSATGGDRFTITGNPENRFYVLTADWNADGIVNFEDFLTFGYWFLNQTPPDYVDLESPTGVNVHDISFLTANFGKSVTLPGETEQPPLSEAEQQEYSAAIRTLLNPLDVNGNGEVTAFDALLTINELARNGPEQQIVWSKFDVNRDGRITAVDPLRIINWLARNAASGEAEQVVEQHSDSAPLERQVTPEDTITVETALVTDQVDGTRQTQSTQVIEPQAATLASDEDEQSALDELLADDEFLDQLLTLEHS